jgi:tetratricopeptide (TPR) repeat protein
VRHAATRPEPEARPGAGLDAKDRQQAEALLEGLRRRAAMGPKETELVFDLVARYPEEKGLRSLAESVLLATADQAQKARRYSEALEALRRVAGVKPDSSIARQALLAILLETSDWTGAEAAARDLLSLRPGEASALRGLGFALMRQDRNREAAEALEASLEIEEDAAARKMLAHVEKGLRDESGMSEKQLAHFHVRYDGSEHEDVGREILRALERHFASLTGVFDHRPQAPIPVILFSEEAYYDAAGAPRWSGGAYNHLDGRIRIPIGGLSSSLTPDIMPSSTTCRAACARATCTRASPNTWRASASARS